MSGLSTAMADEGSSSVIAIVVLVWSAVRNSFEGSSNGCIGDGSRINQTATSG